MSVQIARRYFTVDEYHRMGEAGIFSEDDRIELIEGEILEMSPIGSRHAATVKRLNMQFNNLLGDLAIVSVQDPVLLNDFSEPELDIAILRRRDDFYADAHPTAADVLLVIEVADTSVAYDHDIKLPAYARSAVPEVWIVDLLAEKVAVYADLVNGVYGNVHSCQRGETITPIHFPSLSLEVVSILGNKL
jgi:Uma2 family endonuclease